MAAKKTELKYKDMPLVRSGKVLYYGNYSDSHMIMLQILSTKKVGDAEVADKVSVQLQLTDPNVRSKDRIIKQSEKKGLYEALDIGAVWLERALSGK